MAPLPDQSPASARPPLPPPAHRLPPSLPLPPLPISHPSRASVRPSTDLFHVPRTLLPVAATSHNQTNNSTTCKARLNKENNCLNPCTFRGRGEGRAAVCSARGEMAEGISFFFLGSVGGGVKAFLPKRNQIPSLMAHALSTSSSSVPKISTIPPDFHHPCGNHYPLPLDCHHPPDFHYPPKMSTSP